MRTMLALTVVATLSWVSVDAQSREWPVQRQPAPQTQQPQQNQQIRFARMDANGDGVITRAEWTGTEQGFRDADWNGDDVLSGVELQPGERYNRQPAASSADAQVTTRPAAAVPARSAR
jgi:hypothetical protein